MIVEVAAGVMEGKMVTDDSCSAPICVSRCKTGRRPVWMAGQTTCGVAASITTRSTFEFTDRVYTMGPQVRRSGMIRRLPDAEMLEKRGRATGMSIDLLEIMEKLFQDLRYGARGFLRQPGFTLTAILALALGIGANTAVFSVVYAVLLKPLPYPDPESLILVHDTYPAVPSASVSFAKLVALRQQTRTLSALGGFAPAGLTLTGGSEAEQIPGTRVSADFFKAFEVAPLYGRWF